MSLLDFQVSQVEKLIKAYNHSNVAVDSSDTGVGKTYIAAAISQKLKKRPIVICPKSVITPWFRVMASFGLEPYGVSNYESIKSASWYDGKTRNKGKCDFISYANDEYTWTLPDDAILIFDEAHRCKNKSTHNAKMLLAAKVTTNKVLLLSATIADKPEFFSVFAFMLDFCPDIKLYNIFLKRLQKLCPDKPIMYLLHKRLFPRHGGRLRVVELGDKFPKNLILPDAYSMGDDVEKQIQAQYEYIDTVASNAKEKEESANCVLVQLLRARQRIEALKVPTLKELAQDHLDSGMSVVVFVNFRDTMSILATELGAKCMIHGDQTLAERDKAIDMFQTNQERLIICQIRSGGVGIGLHDTDGNFPRVSIISPSWSAQDLVQALGRTPRAGAKSPVIQKIVYCANTVEERICAVVQSKLNNYSQINDGKLVAEISIVEAEDK